MSLDSVRASKPRVLYEPKAGMPLYVDREIYSRLGGETERRNLVERFVVEKRTGKASILEALGRAYFNQGQPDLAAERFEAIVEADPLAHYAHFGLGLAAKRLGHRSVAARHLRMATVLAPDNEDYRRALRRLGDVA